MTCKLCLREKQLLKKSHIIPDFMYKELFDEGHFLYTRKITGGEVIRKGRRPTGEYDSKILCRECDNEVIGQYESYANQVLYGSGANAVSNEVNQHGIISTRIELDYTKFKLFLLSILWRASISRREFFSDVNLGTTHEEIVRQMLYEGIPGRYTDYPCTIITIRNMPEARWSAIASPIRSKSYRMTNYVFPIAGIYYFFSVTRGKLPTQLAEIVNASAIREEGWMSIVHSPNKDFETMMFRGMLGLKP